MNRIYQLVWNRALKVLQVASELTRSPSAAAIKGDSPRPSRTRHPLFRACAIALALGGVATMSPAWAANTYNVNQITDDGNGYTVGSLSWAIDQANANPGSVIAINLRCCAYTTITETGTLPDIMANTSFSGQTLQIVGAGAAPLTISQSSTLQLASSIIGASGSGSSDNGVDAVKGGDHGALIVLSGGAVTGGAGGTGSNGGNGGNGGTGFDGNGFSNRLTNSGIITGGAGGYAGGASGNGGNGGTAVIGSNFALFNQAGGQIIGGAGGSTASITPSRHVGSMGNAVVATGNSSVTNNGILRGATAVAFSGGNNTLTLNTGSTTTGKITSSSGSTNGGDTLYLGGANTGGSNSLNLSNVSGFATYAKTDTGTWTLNGTGAANSGLYWQVLNGTLRVASGASLRGEMEVTGGTLDNMGSITSFSSNPSNQTVNATNVAVRTDNPAARVTNHNGGTISGSAVGIYTDTGGGGIIANSGQGSTIEGQVGILAGSKVPLTVNNTDGAMIVGTYDGIALISGGTVVNGSGSIIQTRTPMAGDCVQSIGMCSIVVVAGALTLSNAGTLIGNVQMDSSAANLTTLSAGGVIQGDLDIGTNTAATLTLDGDNAAAQAYSQAVTGSTTFAGNLIKSGSGTWVVDSNDLASVAGTTINAGTLQVGNGGTTGSIGNGNVADNGALVFDRSDAVNFTGTVSGAGSLTQQGSGTLTLTGANTYGGGTTISAGTLQVGNGTQQGAIGSGTIADNGALVFDNPNATTVDSVITGTGSLTQQGSGTLILNGSSSYSGLSEVRSGTLVVGDASNPAASIAGNVQVDNGATLSGFGSAGGTGGTVTVASGGIIAPGSPGNTGNLGVGGDLVAEQGSLLNFEFGSADASFSSTGDSDSVSVAGNLALNGATLNVTDVGGMGAGLYTVLSYGGTLTQTNGGLTLGTTPAGQSLFLQNLTGQKQINLIDSTGYTLNVWNANGQASSTQLGGGSGTWSLASPEWTDITGTVPNAPAAQQSDFALFGGTPGTVTVDDSAGMVNVAAMQFSVNGYTLTGDALTLVPNSSGNKPTIRVGDGSRASTAMKATIDNVLTGSNGLTKIGLGTLVLAGANTYSGGTTINGGTLSVSNDGNLGAASGGVTFNGGTLENSAAFTTARNVVLAGNGTLQTDASLGVSGVISGSGALAKTGNGTLTLTGANTYSGGTAINGGTLSVSNDGNLGAAAGRLTFNGGILENSAAFATARNVVLAGNGTLQTNANLGVSGVISGRGALTKTGNGTLTLTGANTYSGGTAINGGTLQVGNGVQQGSIGSGNIADNGSLVFDNPSATTVGSAITGTGSLTQQGGGTLTLTGANSYSGGTVINGGTLQVGNGTQQGSIGSGNIADNGSLVFDNPSATTVGSAITGTGSLTQQGSGTLTLTGANTYSGGTAIDGGTLSVSNDGNLGAAAGGVTFNGGTLENSAAFTSARNLVLAGNGTVQTNADLGVSGVISGSGALTKTGNGTLTLTGANTYSGGTAIDGGTLSVSNDGNLGAAAGGVTFNGGTLENSAAFDTARNVVLAGNGTVQTNADLGVSGVISGSGALTKTGNGTLTLTGANTYSGGTAISAGTLQVGNGVQQGLIGSGDIADNGSLVFDNPSATTVDSAITGTGTLTQQGSGTLTLTGANTYSGGTAINGGTLSVSNDGNLGAAAGGVTFNGGTLENSAAFTTARNLVLAGNGTLQTDANLVASGTISGTGVLTKSGDGSLVLDGDSSAFTGSTTVQSGMLEVGDAATPSATLGGNVSVDAGATLRGHGSIGGNVVSDGTVWAGGSIGTLTIGGNYTQNADGTLEVEATLQGQSSLLAIHGAANLAGSALVLGDNGTWAPSTEYTILTANGGVNGQFASASDNFAFLNPVLTYEANAVKLSLQRNEVNFNSLALTPNERAVATTANALSSGNPVYDALVTLDAATAPRAFNQLSGEIHASTRTAIADNDHYVRDAISQHLASQDNNANGLKVTDADGVTAWTSAWGRLGSHDGNGNASAMDDNGSGLLFGADMPVDGSTRIGALVGTGVGTARISALASSSHVVDQHLGIYGSTQTGALLWQGAGIYGWQRVNTTRFMGFGSFSGTATSSYHAHTAQAYVDASLPIMLGSTTLAPFANVAVERVSTPTIQENGTPAALSVAAQDSTIGYGTLGLRSTFDLGAPNHGLHAHVSVGWQHAWGDTLPVDAVRFQSGGDSFDIAGLPVLRNAGVVNAGLSFTVAPNVSVDTTYQGQFGKRSNDQSARVSLDWKF